MHNQNEFVDSEPVLTALHLAFSLHPVPSAVLGINGSVAAVAQSKCSLMIKGDIS